MPSGKPMGVVYESIDHLFEGRDPIVRKLYDRVVTSAKKFGKVEIQPRKTCVHLANGSAFCGIHPRKSSIAVTLRTKSPLQSKRIVKSEQASKNRAYNDLRIEKPEDLDAEFLGWLKQAYEMET